MIAAVRLGTVWIVSSLVILCAIVSPAALARNDLQVLFLGDNGPHRPRERFAQLEPVLRGRGINLTYTNQVADLNPSKLAQFEALVLYANIERIEPAQERALLDYVAAGHGFVPIHCASFCFQNSDACIALIGAQFKSHGWARMRETIAQPDAAVIRGYDGFESLDETYVHHKHNDKDRTVLSYRIDGDKREPWTWIRQHGKGRVFYTAWGHDHHTWSHPGFHNLIERGIRWSAGGNPHEAGPFHSRAPFVAPEMTRLPPGPPPFEYADVGAKIPNYVPSQKWGQQGKPFTKMQKPLSPQESMRRMIVPQGFHVELFAAEPDIAGKPICVNWDERGRLWVCETFDYPNELERGNEGRDRIRICEDTNGDDRADKFTVFAERLSIPTSLAFARGGVIVHNGTETLFLKDTNGDDKADERRVLISKWSLGDTHGGPSNLQYGLDNWIWGMQGYNKSVIRIGDKSIRFAQGFHRFRPDGSAIEFVRSTNNNTWGFGISEEGIIFGSTANGCPSVYMPIANRYYERVRGWTPKLTLESIADSNRFHPITDKVRQVDHHGGYTAAAGHALYTARRYPETYWNRTAFVCEPTGHLVSLMALSPDGADFHATSAANLLASDDEWVAPTMAEVGPDGNVWVIDWYNYIVQHNPTPQGFQTGKGAAYESDLRDKKHGRVYRIVYDSSQPPPKLDLSKATPDELVSALANDNLFWRRNAQRLLVERGKLDVIPQLLKLVGDQSVDTLGLNVGAIHALWTLYGLGAIGDAHSEAKNAVLASLRHPSAGVRRSAVQVLPNASASTDAILQSKLLDDPDFQVRLQTLLALSDLPPSDNAGRAVAQFLTRRENIEDRWLVDAATCAAAANAPEFLVASVAIRSPATQLLTVCKTVANHYARKQPGQSAERLLVELPKANSKLAAAIIAGLDLGWPSESPLPNSEATRGAFKQLLASLPLDERVRLARFATRSGDSQMHEVLSQLKDDLFTKIENKETSISERVVAAELIISAEPSDVEAGRRLLELVTPQSPPDFSLGVVRALGKSDAANLGPIVIAHLTKLTPSVREAVFELLLSRPTLAAKLIDELENGNVTLTELSLAQKERLREYPDRRLRERAKAIFAKAQESVSSDRKQVVTELADVANAKGDPVSGKALFTKTCLVCHRYQGEGLSVGPDLTGMGVHGKQQLLVHILDPSRDVEGNYQAYVVVLNDGRVLNGMLAGESSTSIDLIDGEGKRRAILREDIEELTRTGKSFMPEGFEKQLSRVQLSDILEFLTQRSQFVPLDIRRVATISSVGNMFHSPGAEYERLMFDEWGAKSFEGVPFYPTDPQGGRIRNVIMLHGDLGSVAPKMPESVELPCGIRAKAVHLLSGVSGWGYPASSAGTVSMIVRLHYADNTTEDHALVNGVHFADYVGRTEVTASKLAFSLGRQQMRYLKIEPRRNESIEKIELIKGPDKTAPLVMAITVEQR
jgi:putative membrane-bound dehydrogenase-like protein